MPSISPFACGKSNVTIVRQCSIWRIWPRHSLGKKAHDFPTRKKLLRLFRIRQFKRTQPQAWCFKCRHHLAGLRCGKATHYIVRFRACIWFGVITSYHLSDRSMVESDSSTENAPFLCSDRNFCAEFTNCGTATTGRSSRSMRPVVYWLDILGEPSDAEIE